MSHQVNHLPRSRRRVIANLTSLDDSHMGDFVLCSVAIAKQGGGLLGPSAMSVMMFILGRTLAFRKKAEVITTQQFEKGVVGKDGVSISSGCGVSTSTTRRALKELSEVGFIRIHTFSDGHKEQHARAYEVLTDAIKATADLESAKNWFKRSGFYGQNYAEGGVKFEPQTDETGKKVPFLGCQIYHTITDNDKSLSNKILSNDNISQPTAATQEEELIPTPRKGRTPSKIAIDCKVPAKDIPSIVSAKHSTAINSRAAASRKVSTRRWTTPELQALLDKARANVQEAGAQVNRIVVVSKNIGVFHKRMLASEIPDALEFLEWVFKNWGKVANSNKRAKARQTKVNQRTESVMSLTPNFNDLAFRLPYIIALYNDSQSVELVEQQLKQEERELEEKKTATRKQVIDARRKAAEERDRAEASKIKRTTKRVTREVTRDIHEEDYGDELPEWKER